MSGVDVCVVCNSDAETESWSSYIVKQASSTSSESGVSSRTLLDTDLRRPLSADTLLTARLVVVVVSSGHLEYLRSCPSDGDPVYGACSPAHSLILLCGVSDDDLRQVSHHFPGYVSWQRIQYNVEQSVLTEKLKTLMSPGVKLLQSTARCEEETLMVLSFTDALLSSATVEVVLLNAAEHHEEELIEKIAATRVNPYTYTFNAPADHRVGEVTAEVYIDQQFVTSLKITYMSAGSLLADVTQVYMHLLNTVCSQLVPQSGPPRPPTPLTVSSLDEKLSSLFDEDLTTVPAQAFEQLFGAHRHDVDMDKDFELPTLIHFAAKFGFKELCAQLIDLPDASYAGKFSNRNGQQPNDIANAYRHTELCHFLESFLEMDREFESMYITYYNEKGDTMAGGGRYENTSPTERTVEESAYMTMDGSHRQRAKEEAEAKHVPAVERAAVPSSVTRKTTAINSRPPAASRVADSHVMPTSQQELIEIMELVKAQKISQAKAEVMFRDWKTRHEGRQAKSFREKQERLTKMNEAVRQAMSETQIAKTTLGVAACHNVRLSDASVGSRSSTASRSSVTTSGIDTDFDEPAPPVVPRRQLPSKQRQKTNH